MNKKVILVVLAIAASMSVHAESSDPFFDLSCSKSQVKVVGNQTSLILAECFLGKYRDVSQVEREKLETYGVVINYHRGLQMGVDPVPLLKLFQEIQQQQSRVDLTAGYHQFNSSGGMSGHWVIDRIESLDQNDLPYLSIRTNNPNVD